MNDVDALITRLGLQPHPEGGWYREVHRSAVLVEHQGAQRPACTHIHYLLADGQRSRLHRVRGCDELWHFADGSPLELLLVAPDGTMQRHRLGPAGDPHALVPPGWWQAARPLGPWSLVGCTVAPGFSFADFDFASGCDDGRRLLDACPDLAGWG